MLRAALAEDPSLPQISKNLADILYRNGRYDEAREAYERAAKLDARSGRRSLLQARQHRLQAAGPRTGAGELAPGDRAESRPRAGARQPRHAGRRPMTPADDAGFAALARKISPGLRLRRRGLQGQVHPPAHRGADAGLRRPHLRRLSARSSIAARRSTSGCATRSPSTSPGSTGTRRPGTCSAGDLIPAAVRVRRPARSGSGAPAARRARRPTPSPSWSPSTSSAPDARASSSG